MDKYAGRPRTAFPRNSHCPKKNAIDDQAAARLKESGKHNESLTSGVSIMAKKASVSDSAKGRKSKRSVSKVGQDMLQSARCGSNSPHEVN